MRNRCDGTTGIEWDVVAGILQESLRLWSCARRSQHRAPFSIGVVEQDRQHEAMLDPVQIKHRLPSGEPQAHGREESHNQAAKLSNGTEPPHAEDASFTTNG
jgi:hypothetical protein